ncbi:DUF1697 domain-containing protein [Thalassobellus suaedae]|uniref:DUF1697 domain-containing protein n=1 Tax=Thalassobellus suaedae TaxID=3074124 RepID=A0ABY9Y5Y1_9FLAO|nr:DUF1697 domain-containing protein [Flavobacteriaceae bacterium HL-DH10]
MNTYIALLRGINVSGQKKVSMAELRELLSKSGLENVQTYIQSGNVIFQSSEKSIKALENNIQKSILDHFGFEVPVLVRTPKELKIIFDTCPFPETNKENSYFSILHVVPDVNLIIETQEIQYPNEEFVITDDCVYFYSPVGYGKAKCNNNFFERKLKVSVTTRNYKTMLKLLSLSTEIG